MTATVVDLHQLNALILMVAMSVHVNNIVDTDYLQMEQHVKVCSRNYSIYIYIYSFICATEAHHPHFHGSLSVATYIVMFVSMHAHKHN